MCVRVHVGACGCVCVWHRCNISRHVPLMYCLAACRSIDYAYWCGFDIAMLWKQTPSSSGNSVQR